MLAIRYTIETLPGQLIQTCPALAIKTATILELVSRGVVEKVEVVRRLRRIKAKM